MAEIDEQFENERARQHQAARRLHAIDEHPIRLSDLGNGKRLARANRDTLRYCNEFGKWLAWNVTHWEDDKSGEVYRRAKAITQALFVEAALPTLDAEERKKQFIWAMKSESQPRLEAMISLARSEPGIPIEANELDRDPFLLNCRNGTLDLITGELREHNPDDFITRCLEIDYEPDAQCPLWLEFLDRIMAGKATLKEYLRRVVGYCLTGSTVERILFIDYGTGANGKSVFVGTLGNLFGAYAVRTPTSTLMRKRDAGIPNDIAALKGARLVYCSESEEGQRLAESLIKDITGGDIISARFMRAEWFSFKPEFKLLMGTNHKPVVRDTTQAIWDRIRLIPFEVRIPPEEQDKTLTDRLREELPGILAWAVRGCLDWQTQGLGTPSEVLFATQEYRAESDSFASFVEECCLIGADFWTASKELREAYEAWAGERGEHHLLSGNSFTERLKQLGCNSRKLDNRRGWSGIKLEGKQ